MADRKEREANFPVEKQHQQSDGASEQPHEHNSTLETFVTDHYMKQKEAGRLDSTDEISDERTNQFFSRALSESRRMNEEIGKSNKKLDALRTEFGLEMVNSWHEEHASQVLNRQEQELVMQSKYNGVVEDSVSSTG